MVYAFEQDVPIDKTFYARIIENLGSEPLPGLMVHLCVTHPEGGLRYIDVWETEEHCRAAFADRIHPAVDAALGASRPDGEPQLRPLELLHASGAITVDLT